MIVIIMLIAGLIGGFLAQAKGKNIFLWSVLSAVVPVAILFLAFMKREA